MGIIDPEIAMSLVLSPNTTPQRFFRRKAVFRRKCAMIMIIYLVLRKGILADICI